jgi:hypothetical protein
MILYDVPVRVKLLEDGASARYVKEGGDAGRLDARRAAGEGKGEATLDLVDVGVLGEGELQLVSKGRPGSDVEEGPRRGLLSGVLQLGALRRRRGQCRHGRGGPRTDHRPSSISASAWWFAGMPAGVAVVQVRLTIAEPR